jgi:hypothetical protein
MSCLCFGGGDDDDDDDAYSNCLTCSMLWKLLELLLSLSSLAAMIFDAASAAWPLARAAFALLSSILCNRSARH